MPIKGVFFPLMMSSSGGAARYNGCSGAPLYHAFHTKTITHFSQCRAMVIDLIAVWFVEMLFPLTVRKVCCRLVAIRPFLAASARCKIAVVLIGFGGLVVGQFITDQDEQ